MLNARVLSSQQYVSQPWKNGQGTTRQIAVDSRQPYGWRFSWSDLKSSGPFSNYDGYDRVLTVLGGNGIELQHTQEPPRFLPPLTPYDFAGEEKTEATVTEPTQDLNLFCRRGICHGAMYLTKIRQGEEYLLPYRGNEHFLFLISGSVKVQERNLLQEFPLQAQDTYWASRPGEKHFLDVRAVGVSEISTAIWVVVHENQGTGFPKKKRLS